MHNLLNGKMFRVPKCAEAKVVLDIVFVLHFLNESMTSFRYITRNTNRMVAARIGLAPSARWPHNWVIRDLMDASMTSIVASECWLEFDNTKTVQWWWRQCAVHFALPGPIANLIKLKLQCELGMRERFAREILSGVYCWAILISFFYLAETFLCPKKTKTPSFNFSLII